MFLYIDGHCLLITSGYGSSTVGKLSRSSTQKLIPIRTTCTAQTVKPCNGQTQNYHPSPKSAAAVNAGKRSGTFHRKLFPLAMENNEEYQEREVIDKSEKQKQEVRARQRLELPSRGTHRRSRSDMLDSFCDVNQWVEYEKRRDLELGLRAPMAEPESLCNVSILNLESHGKFITNRDIAALKTTNDNQDVHNIETGPILRMPLSDVDRNKKVEKKSSVGGFFSKLGRAVMKPRGAYSEGDQYPLQYTKSMKERKMSFKFDKENVNIEPNPAFERCGVRDSKRLKSADGNGNKVSQFFKRGGLYRSSKMKKKNQNTGAV